jgi:DNA-binding transcriptional LysR family regulator
VDLNLLKGLDALLEQRSVQDAAGQLGLTQPAVSRILARLRAATGDEILVRNGREMVPTARALELREEVRDLVARAESVLAPARDLDLAQLSRRFTIRSHDAVLTALAPALVQAVTRSAPGVSLRLVGEHPSDDKELSRGTVDLTVDCPSAPASASIMSRTVGTDDMVLVVARGHALDVAAPTAGQIAGAAHVLVTRHENPSGPLAQILAGLGLRLNVTATVPTVSAALAIVSTSTAVTVLPRRLRDPLPAGVFARPLPFPLTTGPATVSWHRRHKDDPAHTWLRTLVADILEDLLDQPAVVPGKQTVRAKNAITEAAIRR